MVRPIRMFAVASPGLEPVVLKEVEALGSKVFNVRQQVGGVGFSGHRRALFEANLRLRSAARVLLRLGRFTAKTPDEFLFKFREIPWTDYLQLSDNMFNLTINTNKGSELSHSKRVEALVLKALENFNVSNQTVESQVGIVQNHLIINIINNEVAVSLNSSGDHLHKRLYRQGEPAVMPLKETAASGFLHFLRWEELQNPTTQFVDPFCGTGTLAIETALLRANKAPGLVRLENGGSFNFQHWPLYEHAPDFASAVEEAQHAIKPPPPAKRILGSDRNESILETANVCAEKAGVREWVEFEHAALGNARFPSDSGSGIIVTNPPFGPRAGQAHQLSSLYEAFGNIVREKADGWKVGIFCPSATENRKLLRSTRLTYLQDDLFLNGGRRMVVARGEVRQVKPKKPQNSFKGKHSWKKNASTQESGNDAEEESVQTLDNNSSSHPVDTPEPGLLDTKPSPKVENTPREQDYFSDTSVSSAVNQEKESATKSSGAILEKKTE